MLLYQRDRGSKTSRAATIRPGDVAQHRGGPDDFMVGCRQLMGSVAQLQQIEIRSPPIVRGRGRITCSHLQSSCEASRCAGRGVPSPWRVDRRPRVAGVHSASDPPGRSRFLRRRVVRACTTRPNMRTPSSFASTGLGAPWMQAARRRLADGRPSGSSEPGEATLASISPGARARPDAYTPGYTSQKRVFVDCAIPVP